MMVVESMTPTPIAEPTMKISRSVMYTYLVASSISSPSFGLSSPAGTRRVLGLLRKLWSSIDLLISKEDISRVASAIF
jgi:hypothetical protein